MQLNDGGWVAWLPDGERLATGGYYRSLRFWDAVSGQLLIEFEGNDAMWSPDGMRVAGGFHDMIYVWDALTGERLATLVGHTSWVNSIDWSPDGEYLVREATTARAALARDGYVLHGDDQCRKRANSGTRPTPTTRTSGPPSKARS
ncbi:MAG: hypothetical protein M5R40_19370 [Anaerolineae bacterium]|nr:hypothetical protein [Anaerolineae bacterium]